MDAKYNFCSNIFDVNQYVVQTSWVQSKNIVQTFWVQSKTFVHTFGCKTTQTFVQNFGESLCLIMSVDQDFCA